jgi:succinate-semialdehyde dehydrogenase/glutarate-semialdehyde dehydrogenase
MAIASINPATGQTLKTFVPLTDSDIENKLQSAVRAYQTHRRTDFGARAAAMNQAAEILESDKEKFGRLMTLEMGKPLKAAVEEVVKSAWGCRYYAENAERFLTAEEIVTNASRSGILYQPLGPILAVMPWNFPFWQVFRFAAPALMAGNVGLLKHASNVPQSALAIEEVFRRAGFPEGVFQTLLIEAKQVRQVIEDRRIAAATLTGSEPAGQQVASTAGRQIKKTVLELGGSDPFIVMASANLEAAVSTAVKARIINNGQSCIAAKRFIISERIADQFENRFLQEMRNVRIGDPMDDSTELGPIASEELLKTLEDQVNRSEKAGARVLLGGKRLNQPGYFYPATVLRDIPPDSPAFKEEIFGPVACLFRVNDAAEAIHLANGSDFGLGCSVWTQDEHERELFLSEIESGLVFVNAMVASDPRLPFGGVKHSGYGRELSSHGIREFVNIKTFWIK